MIGAGIKTHARTRSRARRAVCALLGAIVLGAVGAPASTYAIAGANGAATTPTFPVPASARVHPTSTATTGASASGNVFAPSSTSTATRPHKRTKPRSTSSGKPSNAAIAIAALAALVALACLAWGVSRVLTFEPRWTLSLRHAMAEASFRASATWSEFSDWARLGR
jgi:hypothetical protein